MNYGSYIALAIAAAVTFLAMTGWWRPALGLFRIRPSTMTVERLGLLISSPASVERVNTILRSFAGGFNAMISQPSSSAWLQYCDELPAFYRPFAHEGAAMGFTLRRLFRYDAAAFESQIVRPHSEFCYLHYVGLGFWSGMRRHSPGRLKRVVAGLDPLHRYLCYDGYGFSHAFFVYPKDPAGLRPLDRLDGYARNAAHHGVGRAFYFLYMERPEVLIERIRQLGAYAEDAIAGVGLAAVFVHPDRLETAREFAATLPPAWQPHYQLGMCFGLKARSLNDPAQFQRYLAGQSAVSRRAVEEAIETCDRIELQIRSEGGEDGYQRWRGLVTEWLANQEEWISALFVGGPPETRGVDEERIDPLVNTGRKETVS